MTITFLREFFTDRSCLAGVARRIVPYIACGMLIELALFARPLAAAFGKGTALAVLLPLMAGLAFLALRLGRGTGGRTAILFLMELHAGIVIPLALYVLVTAPSIAGAVRLVFALIEAFCVIVLSRDETVLNS
jgi:hypothetical protein